jgi:hypothetical protein
MHPRYLALIAGLLVSAAVGAQAPAPGNTLALPIDPALLNELPELKGVLSWQVLGQVKSRTVGNRVVPDFAPAVRELDKAQVKLQGYMLPIVTGEQHDHFLLTMRPPHCPFCLSLGPEYIVEVRASRPIKHTYEPIVLSGRFSVLTDDPFGLYYRLTAAQVSAAPRR